MSANREHEHREFCSKKLLNPSYADWMREALASGSDEYAAGGFTNLRHDDTPAGKHWICRACFYDFLTEHHWDVERYRIQARGRTTHLSRVLVRPLMTRREATVLEGRGDRPATASHLANVNRHVTEGRAARAAG